MFSISVRGREFGMLECPDAVIMLPLARCTDAVGLRLVAISRIFLTGACGEPQGLRLPYVRLAKKVSPRCGLVSTGADQFLDNSQSIRRTVEHDKKHETEAG